MNDAQLAKLSRKFRAKSDKAEAAEVVKGGQQPSDKLFAQTVLHDITGKAFQEFAAKCESKKDWPDSSGGYKMCGLTTWACRDCICPKLKEV